MQKHKDLLMCLCVFSCVASAFESILMRFLIWFLFFFLVFWLTGSIWFVYYSFSPVFLALGFQKAWLQSSVWRFCAPPRVTGFRRLVINQGCLIPPGTEPEPRPIFNFLIKEELCKNRGTNFSPLFEEASSSIRLSGNVDNPNEGLASSVWLAIPSASSVRLFVLK